MNQCSKHAKPRKLRTQKISTLKVPIGKKRMSSETLRTTRREVETLMDAQQTACLFFFLSRNKMPTRCGLYFFFFNYIDEVVCRVIYICSSTGFRGGPIPPKGLQIISDSVLLHDQKCESSIHGWAVKIIKNQKGTRHISQGTDPERGFTCCSKYLLDDSTRFDLTIDSDILFAHGIQCQIYKEATNTPHMHVTNLPRLARFDHYR